MTREVVVIGDVHGNARALRAALELARRFSFDDLVFAGDLLTYGPDVRDVIDLVHEAQARHHATVLVGNHDQMYFDLADGNEEYFSRLPPWIQDSAALARTALGSTSLRDALEWLPEHVLDGVLFAHASPHGAGDWTYITSAAEHERASEALRARGLRAGIFGHTHRTRWYVGDAAAATQDAEIGTSLHASASSTLVANAGAIGQPRDGTGYARILRLAIGDHAVTGTFERVDYDVRAHLAAVRALPLHEATIARLCSFFGPRPTHDQL